MSIDIYGRPDCPHCVKAKAHAEQLGVKVRYFDIWAEPRLRIELVNRAGYAPETLPQIFIGPHHIGGSTDLLSIPTAVIQQIAGGE